MWVEYLHRVKESAKLYINCVTDKRRENKINIVVRCPKTLLGWGFLSYDKITWHTAGLCFLTRWLLRVIDYCSQFKVKGSEFKYTSNMDRSPVHQRDAEDKHSHHSQTNLTVTFWDFERKPAYLTKTFSCTGRTCKLLKEFGLRFKPRTF